ncbi:MAG: TPM domain-containing protein [Nanoarchaeota archaeon]
MRSSFVLAFLFILATSVFAQQLTGFVRDDAKILTQEQAQIEQIARQLYDKDLAQLAVVTIPSLEGQPIETVAFTLAEGTLGTKDKNNGLLLLIAVEDREYRFEVGRGLEPIFNDAKVGRYGRDFLVPAFQQQQYGQGVLLVLNEIHKELTGEELEHVPVNASRPEITNVQIGMAVFFFVFFITVIVLSLLRNKKRGHLSRRMGRDDKFFWAALIASQILRGGRGGFGGSGGFGGFGGGSFGGGGSSGKW